MRKENMLFLLLWEALQSQHNKSIYVSQFCNKVWNKELERNSMYFSYNIFKWAIYNNNDGLTSSSKQVGKIPILPNNNLVWFPTIPVGGLSYFISWTKIAFCFSF